MEVNAITTQAGTVVEPQPTKSTTSKKNNGSEKEPAMIEVQAPFPQAPSATSEGQSSSVGSDQASSGLCQNT